VYANRQREPASPGPPWPYHADDAWYETMVDLGWLGPALAEQLFLGAYGERPDLALCRDCRARAGLELIAAWSATTPPADGWDRAQWLMEHGFEPARVAASVDVGPRRTVLHRFVVAAGRASQVSGVGGTGDSAPDRLTIVWQRDRKGRATPISTATGWSLAGEAAVALRPGADGEGGPHAHLFVSTDGAAYVYGRDCDPSAGRVAATKRGWSMEYRRLPDDRWQPGRLALLAFLMGANQPAVEGGHTDTTRHAAESAESFEPAAAEDPAARQSAAG
jgi:hypothetical protein